MFCGIDNIPQNTNHIQIECVECYKSHKTLLWIWIMLWPNPLACENKYKDIQVFLMSKLPHPESGVKLLSMAL